MLESARRLVQRGLELRVVAVNDDDDETRKSDTRDLDMATAILALHRSQRRRVVVLVGNLHARTVKGFDDEPEMLFTGTIVKRQVPTAVALDLSYSSGEAWMCFWAKASRVRAEKAEGLRRGAPWKINLFPRSMRQACPAQYRLGDRSRPNPREPHRQSVDSDSGGQSSQRLGFDGAIARRPARRARTAMPSLAACPPRRRGDHPSGDRGWRGRRKYRGLHQDRERPLSEVGLAVVRTAAARAVVTRRLSRSALVSTAIRTCEGEGGVRWTALQ